MNQDIIDVKALPDHVLEVTLADGRHGTFDLKPHLAHPGLRALQDPAYFASVTALAGAPTWPNGEDIAPSTVAAELKTMESV